MRAFDNPEVVHVDDSVDPIRQEFLIITPISRSFSLQQFFRDMETIMYELCRKDTAYVDSVRARKEMDVKRDPKNKLPPVFFTVMDKVKELLGMCLSLSSFVQCSKSFPILLDKNHPLRSVNWTIEEVAKINELIPQCITLKPIVYLVNLDAKSFKKKANKWLVGESGSLHKMNNFFIPINPNAI